MNLDQHQMFDDRGEMNSAVAVGSGLNNLTTGI